MRVAIIGAGMTGASAASALAEAGVKVTIFDKGRGPGGRMSSKRLIRDEAIGGYLQLDLGAQYFTARHPWFLRQVLQWQHQGVVQRWDFAPYVWQHALLLPSNDATTRYVGTPAMHQMLRAQLGTLVQHYSCQVTELSYSLSSFSSQQAGEWTVSTADGASYAGFDALLLTCPPEQCRKLLATHPLAEQIPSDLLLPCWAVAIELAAPVTHPAVGVFGKSGALSWCARHNAKPGRPATSEHWVLHVNAKTSLQLLEATPEEVAAVAAQAFSQIVGQPLQVTSAFCHRWLYASYNVQVPAPGVLSEPAQQLVVAGDWSLGGRVENAWLAGIIAASRLLPERIQAPDLSATAADFMLAT